MKGLARSATIAATVCATVAIGSAPALAKTNRHAASHRTTAHSYSERSADTIFGLPVTPGSGYLALGDSVTFGYEEPQVVPAPDYADASSFPNYPQMLGTELDLTTANLACPGETSASFINTSAVSNGCENTLGDTADSYLGRGYPLHDTYSGSQLAAAVAYLEANPKVRLVTLMLGANDFFVCEETTSDQCASTSERVSVALTVIKNIRTILAAIRNQAHYRGQIVMVNYYSTNYSIQSDNLDSGLLNTTQDLAAVGYGVKFADGYGLFKAASVDSGGNTCTAGLLTQLVDASTPCGVHPSYAGDALLAQAVEDAIKL